MKIVVTGGAGFLGARVIKRLLADKDAGRGSVSFDRIVSIDLGPTPVDDPRVTSVTGNIADPALFAEHIDADVVAIFHLAAVLSGGSEEDFDLAYEVNVNATLHLLEAARRRARTPRVIFTSSLAVFGGELPAVVTDAQAVQPESTYGTVKAVGELLVNEYSRRRYIDGRVCRVPTISVRPGMPNSAASSFASGIIREPLAGVASNVPVPTDTRMWLSSPDVAVANLTRMLEVAPKDLPAWRVINLPGISVTVDEMLRVLTLVGGASARELVSVNLDQGIIDIVGTWPQEFDVSMARELGFEADNSFEAIVRQYYEEFVRPSR